MKEQVLVFGPLISGHIQKWIARLTDRYDISVVTLHPGKNDNYNFDVIRIPRLTRTKLDFFYTPFFLFYYAVRIKPKFIHVHFLSSYGLFAALSLSWHKMLLSTWGSDVNGIMHSRIKRCLYGFLLRRYGLINSPASHITDKMLELSPSIKERIETFQYGVDIDFFKKVEVFSSRELTPKRMSVRLVSIRNWDEIYRVKDFLLSFLRSSKKFEDVDFYVDVIGRASNNDIEKDFINSISSISSGNVHLNIIGFVDRERLREVLNSSSFAISVPTMDGAPLSLMEAICCDCYPIVSRLEANEEIVRNGNAIFLDEISDASVSMCITAILDIMNSKTLYEKLAENKDVIYERFDYNKNTERLATLYKKLSDSCI
ncbi:glycosyltransferase family 4 protein [Gallaecimonas pentaromativorans]|uniref:glycosyltransferase family 4 protein n=1 Tax=Gallaecimonas pentaromativorans TaxID=584787 RepID=UPI0009FA3C26|nr:glycosyltransferase family 4 protein [Gallaecimonas pentaromativorans]